MPPYEKLRIKYSFSKLLAVGVLRSRKNQFFERFLYSISAVDENKIPGRHKILAGSRVSGEG